MTRVHLFEKVEDGVVTGSLWSTEIVRIILFSRIIPDPIQPGRIFSVGTTLITSNAYFFLERNIFNT